MLKQTLLLASSVALLSGATTMCFKKNHLDPSTIETVVLDGGACGGKLTVEDMQRDGYSVSDIKISSGETGLDYIYIFKKGEPLSTVTTDGKMILSKEDLRAKMQELREEEKAEEKEKIQAGNIESGKVFYESKCAKCHGKKGELNAYGTSRPLKTLSYENMSNSIWEYEFGNRSGSNAFVMKQYIGLITENRLQNISAYLKSIK